MGLDVPTLAVMTVLVGAELALGFLLVGRVLGRQPGLRSWVVFANTMAAGGLIWSARGVLPDLALNLVANGAIFVSLGFAWDGARDFCGQRRSLRPLLLGLPPFLAAMAYFGALVPSTRARVVLASAAAATWAIATALTFFRHSSKDLRGSTWVAGGLFLAHALFQVARMFFPQEGTTTADLLMPGWPRASTALEIIVASVAVPLALVAVVCHRLVRDLGRAARFDVLTGVPNRHSIEREGARMLLASASMGLSSGVLFLDLDRFKAINDAHGHQAGDAALRHFASVVAATLRSSDFFGRWGGEEFVVVMPGTTAEDARVAAERIRARVAAAPAIFRGSEIPLTVSIGVATWSEEGAPDLAKLLSRADLALYRAKDGGRDRVIEAAA